MDIKTFLSALLVIVIAPIVNAEEPKTIFIDSMSVIRPDGQGWLEVGRNRTTVTFQRTDTIAKTSNSAVASLIQFKSQNDSMELETEIKTIVISNLSKMYGANAIKSSSFEFSRKRGYPCVNASAELSQLIDIPQETKSISIPVMMKVMACRQSGKLPFGIFAAYSHASFSIPDHAQQDAQNFLDGVLLDDQYDYSRAK